MKGNLKARKSKTGLLWNNSCLGKLQNCVRKQQVQSVYVYGGIQLLGWGQAQG